MKRFVSLVSILSLFFSQVLANPVGGTVTSGNAAINSNGNKVTVNQSSDKALIDWRKFDIAPKETTEFKQPSSSSLTVNRINDTGPSKIEGALQANGNLVLINQNGILFTKDSKIDVAGIVATSSNINEGQFKNGKLVFDRPGKADAKIINEGTITAKDAGLVGLVAPEVQNRGFIKAKLGKVNLGSGDTFTLDLAGDGLIQLAVTGKVKDQIAANSGVIEAQGGEVYLSAAAARDVVNGLVANTGTINAQSVGNKTGKVRLFAEGSNAVEGNQAKDKGKKLGESQAVNTGVIDVSGYGAGEKGGNVRVLADNVGLLNGSFIDASGDQGGGDIRIGGNYLGTGYTPAAKSSFVDTYTLIYNDAVTNGDGGRTIVWSDGNTHFYGNIYGRGGEASGDGGFTETSGHGYLDAQGFVDLTPQSKTGNRGTYLLDPTDITVYGNVDPAFQSTDGTINLSSNLKLWLDPSDASKVNLTYSSLGTTATGTSGANTITVGASTGLFVGARIRLGGAGAVTAASTLGADTYTISNIAGTTITLSSNLTSNYAGSAVYQGYVSQLTDKSGQGNNATQATANNMPLWVSNGQNSIGVIKLDGSSDYMLTSSFQTFPSKRGTLFATYQNTGSAGGYGAVLATYTSAATSWEWMTATSGTKFKFYPGTGGSQLSAQNDPTTWQIQNITRTSDTSLTHWQNGILLDTLTIANNQPSANAVAVGAHTGGGERLAGNMADILVYDTALSTADHQIVDQYQSAKWAIALTPPGTGATEVAKATASDGYSVFTTRYLERLSQSANIALQATNDIKLDFKGDTLVLAAGRNLTLTGGNSISAVSTGTISTSQSSGTGGNVTFTATAGTIDVSSLTVNGGGDVSLTSAGAMTLGTIGGKTIAARSTGGSSDLTIAASKTLTASAAGDALTLASGRNFINSAGSSAVSAASGRWLVYSTNPASDTIGSLSNNFRRFTCAFGGSCPSLGSGNGLLYTYTPTLTATPGVTKTYGDSADLTGYAYTLSGYLGSDAAADTLGGAINGSTPYTSTSDVGSYAINYTSGSLTSAIGYGFTYASNAMGLTVGKKTLTPGLTGTVSKAYDGTTTATLAVNNYTLTGVINSDDVSIGTTSGTYNDKTVNTGKNVSVTSLTLAGGKAGNYLLSSNSTSGAVGTITTKLLSILGVTVSNKTYDANNTATLNTAGDSLSGVVGGETVTLSNVGISATFADKNVGTSKAVTATGFSISGADSGNYSLSQPAGLLANITAKALSILGVTASNKTYDAATSATLVTAGDSLSGVVAGDTVTLSNAGATGTFADKNVGTNKVVTATGFSIGGADNGNYSLTQPAGLVANITAKALSILGVTASNKTYDGTIAASLNTAGDSLSGVVAGDTVTLSNAGATGTFANKNAGTTKVVTATGFSVGGADSGNYALSQPAGLTADITKKAVDATLSDKNLANGTVTPTLDETDPGDVAWTGFIAGEGVSNLSSVTFSYGGATPGAADAAGTYALDVAALTATNYQLGTSTPGTLTVAAAPSGGSSGPVENAPSPPQVTPPAVPEEPSPSPTPEPEVVLEIPPSVLQAVTNVAARGLPMPETHSATLSIEMSNDSITLTPTNGAAEEDSGASESSGNSHTDCPAGATSNGKGECTSSSSVR